MKSASTLSSGSEPTARREKLCERPQGTSFAPPAHTMWCTRSPRSAKRLTTSNAGCCESSIEWPVLIGRRKKSVGSESGHLGFQPPEPKRYGEKQASIPHWALSPPACRRAYPPFQRGKTARGAADCRISLE